MFTDNLNINLMAMNLTNKVRLMAEVTKVIASCHGDLRRKIEVDVRGKTLDLKVSKECLSRVIESLGSVQVGISQGPTPRRSAHNP